MPYERKWNVHCIQVYNCIIKNWMNVKVVHIYFVIVQVPNGNETNKKRRRRRSRNEVRLKMRDWVVTWPFCNTINWINDSNDGGGCFYCISMLTYTECGFMGWLHHHFDISLPHHSLQYAHLRISQPDTVTITVVCVCGCVNI